MMLKERVSREYAEAIATEFLSRIESLFVSVAICGSIRRNEPMVSDIEIVGIPHNRDVLLSRIEAMRRAGTIRQHEYDLNGRVRWGQTYRGMDYRDMLIELFLADDKNHGYIKWLRTGAGEANQYVMGQLKRYRSPVRMADGKVYHVGYIGAEFNPIRQLHVSNEQTLFDLIGVAYIHPENRIEDSYRKHFMGWTPPAIETIQKHYVDNPPAQLAMF